jgi:toxic protein SymE
MFSEETEMTRKPTPLRLPPRQKPRPTGSDERVLTVADFSTPTTRWRKGELVPMIRMRGQWLEQIGFRIGEFVVVKVEPKRLVLTVAEE